MTEINGAFMLNTLSEYTSPIGLIWRHKLIKIAGVQLTFGNLFIALALLLMSSRLSRAATRIIEKRLIHPFVSDKSSQVTYSTFAFYGSLAAFVTLSLTIAGIPLTVFTVLGGALAIGVGFGSQNIVNNFISGVILLVEKPIKVGDIVELDNIAGSVQSIGTRSTKIRNADGKVFVVPNSFFLEKSVLNWSFETTTVQTVINFGVAYGTDVNLVENVCTDILLNTEGIEQDPLPKVFLENFGESNLDFQIMFWCNLEKVESLAAIRSAVRFKIDKKFKDHKIEMAFPQRDLNLKVGKSLDVRVLS